MRTGRTRTLVAIAAALGIVASLISVTPVNAADVANAAPVAVDDNYTTRPGENLNVAAPGVLSNDSDPDGDDLVVVSFSYSGTGTLALFANGAFIYTPAAGFTGTDTFTYTIADPFGATASATVTIDVANAGPPSPPSGILVSERADRAGAVDLAGETLSGRVAIFLPTTDLFLRVEFRLNGSLVRTEWFPRYDLAGTNWWGTARLLDTRTLPDGEHTVTATVGSWLPWLPTTTLSATFTLAN